MAPSRTPGFTTTLCISEVLQHVHERTVQILLKKLISVSPPLIPSVRPGHLLCGRHHTGPGDPAVYEVWPLSKEEETDIISPVFQTVCGVQ